MWESPRLVVTTPCSLEVAWGGEGELWAVGADSEFAVRNESRPLGVDERNRQRSLKLCTDFCSVLVSQPAALPTDKGY